MTAASYREAVVLLKTRAERFEGSAHLLRALFRGGEWLSPSGHMSVVPLLDGGESDTGRVDADVREFCVRLLQDGALQLQVHAVALCSSSSSRI